MTTPVPGRPISSPQLSDKAAAPSSGEVIVSAKSNDDNQDNDQNQDQYNNSDHL